MTVLILGLASALYIQQGQLDGRMVSSSGKDITAQVRVAGRDILAAKDKSELDRIWKRLGHGQDGRESVYAAYRSDFKSHPTPLVAAGFAGVWRVMFELGQHHLSAFEVSFTDLAQLKARLDKADSMHDAAAIYQDWLLLRDVPSSPFGDEVVVGYSLV